jgi:hypothetical protein
MNFRITFHIVMVSFIAVLCYSTMARAAAILTVSPSGSGTFLVQGTDLDRVAGMDIVIGYDTTTLTNPRVSQGSLISGATMVANTNQPGIIRIAVINAYPKVKSGTGPIVSINFNSLGGSPGKISSFTAHLLDVNGVQLSAQATIVPVDTGNTTAIARQKDDSSGSSDGASISPTLSQQGRPPSAGAYPAVVGGTLTMPSDGNPAEEKAKGETPAPQAETSPEGTASEKADREQTEKEQNQVASVPPVEKKITIHKSILDRFRDFQGEKSPEALKALFAAATMPGIRQEPAIGLADGKARLKVFIDLPASGNKAPNFALSGAKLVSLKKEDSVWVVEAQPEKGAYKATLTTMHGESMTEIPLTVAPQVAIGTGKDGIADEAAFADFLKDRGSEKAPRFDLNADGLRNYIDDYIFTANYLALKAKGTTSGKKSQ